VENIIASLLSGKGAIPLPFLRTRFLSPHCKAECILSENLPIPYLPHWKLIKTRGHTDDSICFYSLDERTLISGDTILNIKGSGELNNFCCNPHEIRESFKKLLPLNIKTIYPGHGEPLYHLDGLGRVAQ